MADLTKEYFDRKFKEQQSHLKTELKQQLDHQTKILKAYSDANQSELARITKKGFDDIIERLDVDERMAKLESEFVQLKKTLSKVTEALNIKN